ncbi:MAG: hypothetical protein HY791_40040 [Deltaproteobacteria bacterium]|nr:hypothetical protein [Deltaproteobacteria bacterium]
MSSSDRVRRAGRSRALTLLGLVAMTLTLMSRPAVAQIAYDAIFYRARAGFNHCYLLRGEDAWSARVINARIVHPATSGTPPRTFCDAYATSPSQAAGLRDCGPRCFADCASFVRRSWAAGHSRDLKVLEAPQGGNCADPADYGGSRFVTASDDDATVVQALADARPGDWCSHADHVVMLFKPQAPNSTTWTTWEATDSPTGIGVLSRTLSPGWLRTISGNACKFDDPNRESGCWHPPSVRAEGPTLELPGNDSEVSDGDLDSLVFRFKRPENFAAIGDYLIWIRWRGEGGSDSSPNWEHRLIRVPIFSFRDEPDRHLATLPGLPGARDFPLDVGETDTIVLPYSRLASAPVGTPVDFKNPDTGEITATWQPNEGKAPRPPATFSQTGLVLEPGKSYSWRARVERYGTMSSDGRTRTLEVVACKADPSGRETVEDCKEAHWSSEFRFRVGGCSDDACRRGEPPPASMECGPAVPIDTTVYTSGCGTATLLTAAPSPGDLLEVDVTVGSGICDGDVWAVPADYAIYGGQMITGAPVDTMPYDFCYGGVAQPTAMAGPATLVHLPPNSANVRVQFHIPESASGCIDYVGAQFGGQCCPYMSSCQPGDQYIGPMVNVFGTGGTHGWSTTRMFSLSVGEIAHDDSNL